MHKLSVFDSYNPNNKDPSFYSDENKNILCDTVIIYHLPSQSYVYINRYRPLVYINKIYTSLY